MVTHIAPIGALLLGSAFLMFAGGLNGIILPVRGTAEGFDTVSLGLLGTGWAIGYVVGCIVTAPLVGRIGHIRAFGAMSAIAAMAVLGSLLLLTPFAWVPLRAASGFCFAGAAMIVESWLNEQTDSSMRGRVFGTYTMVNLAATTAGFLVITAGDPTTYVFFVVCAMFYCLALIPTAVFSTTSPRPLQSVRLDLRSLWRNSPVAVFAVFMVGAANSAFGTLSVVYSEEAGLNLVGIALFSSLPILAGALAQLPFGMFSDRTDRRRVLLVACGIAIAADLVFVFLRPTGVPANLGLVMVFGAAIFAMYPLMIAHANDHAPPGAFIQTSGGLLLVLGLGSIVGPSVAGVLMSGTGRAGLFIVALAAHVLILGFTLWRMSARSAVPENDKAAFVATAPRIAAAEVAIIDPGAMAVQEPEEGETRPPDVEDPSGRSDGRGSKAP